MDMFYAKSCDIGWEQPYLRRNSTGPMHCQSSVNHVSNKVLQSLVALSTVVSISPGATESFVKSLAYYKNIRSQEFQKYALLGKMTKKTVVETTNCTGFFRIYKFLVGKGEIQYNNRCNKITIIIILAAKNRDYKGRENIKKSSNWCAYCTMEETKPGLQEPYANMAHKPLFFILFQFS